MAQRSCAAHGPSRQELPRSSDERQQRRQSRTATAKVGAQVSDWHRQDHGHGDVDRLADYQRGTPAPKQPIHARLLGGYAGITIKDRLRVLQPNDPDSYYQSRELVPNDMLPDLEKAKIVITNYHAFKLRERMELSKGGRSLLQGRGETLTTLETEGQMLQRVMPELMGLKKVLILNDEAHHCYREKPGEEEEGELKGDDRREAEKNTEAARLWISGLETVAASSASTG